MDDENSKVFSSSIIRTKKRTANNYKELLQVEPATPIVTNNICVKSCNFEPKSDKLYIPKKKNGTKVKTVREIRLMLEKDVYSYLMDDLEMQQNYLLRKIKLGCLKDPKLLSIAKKLLASDSPASRTVWRMLMNINPDGKTHPTQFVLWNGKNIKINGSRGGNEKFINMSDDSKIKNVQTQRCGRGSSVNNIIHKKALLENSLHIKFKPGPLRKKKFLDVSYQKHLGDLEVVKLPKPGLEVQPTYGKFIPPAISAFLFHSFADNSNVLSENWANFAVSVLGTSINGTPVQRKRDCCKTYNLNYKCSQNMLLMRRDSEKCYEKIVTSYETETKDIIPVLDDLIITDVKNVINDILGAVEISLEQDKMYSGEDEFRESPIRESSVSTVQPKDNKAKKRSICELDRLDVTVIRIAEHVEKKPKTCTNSHCNLGCICESLSCKYNIKGHCGRVECMFQCICDFSGYHISDFLERNNCTSYLPEIVSKEKTCNLKLAKEEKKFHQTVIVTEDKSIVLKSRKRNSKLSKKYANFYSKTFSKNEKCIKKELLIKVQKMNCSNIEPFCLVHNLYKCFCNGKFVNTSIELAEEIKTSSQKMEAELFSSETSKEINLDSSIDNEEKPQPNQERTIRSLRIKSRLATQTTPSNASIKDNFLSPTETSDDILPETCARTEAYDGRKYSNGYYLATNIKIKEMEMNDAKLQNKLNKIINRKKTDSLSDKTDSLIDNEECTNNSPATVLKKTTVLEENMTEDKSPTVSTNVLSKTQSDISQSLYNKFSNKSKLISWLETSYKQFKRKSDLGNINLCLGPPQPGKMALYPWDFILSRFRERKNYFLITKVKPYRLFMTVNENNQFFASSTNINNIPWSDIDKYPITVKNLLTNATDIRDNFFILFGLAHSWELVGSVTKVNESIASADVNVSDTQNNKSYNEILHVENILKNNTPSTSTVTDTNNSQQNEEGENTNECTSDSSKWFVMTIENDFSEIQFFKKGFFVKYESVMKAINVSRATQKTVRLSSQKCSGQQSDPQFGIYAIPSKNDRCVFIGPYEKDEKLGIETINTTADHKRKRTRGIWITTKKVDNLKVIDNPLSFMPSNSTMENEIPLHSHLNTPNVKENYNVTPDQPNQRNNVIKTLKPIRIGKTNGFYHLASDGMFHQISPEKPTIRKSSSTFVDDTNDKSFENKTQPENPGIFSKKALNKPVAEIAPQVKNPVSQMPIKRKLEGMCILKPEEINQRSFEGRIHVAATSPNSNNNSTDIFDDTIINNDIENFLASSAIQMAPKEEILIISDDEEDVSLISCNWKYQYIICKNIKSLGWIHGRRDSKNRLSFEFPGFKETEFYAENVAFDKINQVLSRKVYVPKNITLEWCTVDDLTQIDERPKLQSSELNADYIMTKKGLCHKSDIIKSIKLPQCITQSVETCFSSASAKPEFKEMKKALLKQLDEKSAELEDKSNILLSETFSHKDTFIESLGSMSHVARLHFNEKLQEIFAATDDASSPDT